MNTEVEPELILEPCVCQKPSQTFGCYRLHKVRVNMSGSR